MCTNQHKSIWLTCSICEAFQEINRIAITAPLSTKEMIELGEYMLHVKNKRMVQLNVSIELVLKSNVTDVSRIVCICTVLWKSH